MNQPIGPEVTNALREIDGLTPDQCEGIARDESSSGLVRDRSSSIAFAQGVKWGLLGGRSWPFRVGTLSRPGVVAEVALAASSRGWVVRLGPVRPEPQPEPAVPAGGHPTGA